MKIIECPRDAMQGLAHFVPTEVKIAYHNLLLQVGFDTLDFGSFVSPKAVPQMADTSLVLQGLDLSSTKTKLLAIVANKRGVEEACAHPHITFLGFPLSVSETFQKRNTNADIQQGLTVIKEALELCDRNGKKLVVYLSMAFGNPYGDVYSIQLVEDFAGRLRNEGCKIISLADTVGLATPQEVQLLGKKVIKLFDDIEIGMHLHTSPATASEKLGAALSVGCQRIDVALGGLGGCPFAEDELVGNMPTEVLVEALKGKATHSFLDMAKLKEAKLFLQKYVNI